VSLLAAFVFALAACGGSGGGGQQGGAGDEPLRVVATYSILEDLVENVGGEEVEVTTLVGPDSDAHTFEPSPRDSAELTEAAVVFENGLGFETWLDELYESSGSDAQRVVVTEGIEPLPAGGEEHGHEHGAGEDHGAEGGHDHGAEGEHTDEHAGEEGHEAGEEHADEHGHDDHAGEGHGEGEHGDEHAEENQEEHADEHAHDHGEYDPHVWHDVQNATLMVEAIRDALVEADPENADTYRQNAEAYLGELEELDAEVTEQVESIPEENRVLFTTHDTFGYFAERYGFEVDTALASASTEASDPSAGEIAALVEEIRASGVPAVFAENVSNPDLMQRIADEAGVELAPPLYTDALGEEGSEGDTYVKMVRYNVRTISEALAG